MKRTFKYRIKYRIPRQKSMRDTPAIMYAQGGKLVVEHITQEQAEEFKQEFERRKALHRKSTS